MNMKPTYLQPSFSSLTVIFWAIPICTILITQIASKLKVHEELAVIKGTILNRQGHNLNIPYVPKPTYLGRK